MSVVNSQQSDNIANQSGKLFKRGFLHIPNAFPSESVLNFKNELDSLFEELKQDQIVRHASNLDDSPGAIVEINRALRHKSALKKFELFQQARKIANDLMGRRVFCAFDHAIYKPSNSGKISWHQDEAYRASVKKMSSIHFWIPLHNVGPEQGGMQYIPHDKAPHAIEHRKHETGHTLVAEPTEESLKHAEPISTKLGDLVVHTPTVLHSSLPNQSDQTRKAWIIHFNPYGPYEVLLPRNILGFVKSRFLH